MIKTRLLSKIKRFARVTLAGRAKPEEDDEEGEEIIIFVEEEDSKASGVRVGLKEKEEKVKVDLLEEKKELESTSRSPPTVSSSPAWESRKLIGRGGWRQIGPSRTSWRGHLEEQEASEEGGRSRSSEARGRSLELDTISLQTQDTGDEEDEVVKKQGVVSLGRAEGRVALRGMGEKVRREGRMVVERSTGVDLLKFTNFLIVTVGVAVFLILSSGTQTKKGIWCF